MSVQPERRAAGVRAPADRRFRRAQVRPTGKRSWRTLVTWKAARMVVIGAVVAIAGFKGVGAALQMPQFQVRHITVRGAEKLSTGELEALVEGLRGDHILTADLDGYRQRLLQSPWVASASLRRVLPATIEVTVSERRPMGLARIDGRLFLIDPTGVVIEEHGAQHAQYDLPIVDGLDGDPRDTGFLIDPSRAMLAARVIDAASADQQIGPRLSEINVSDAHDAVVLLEGDRALLHVGESRFVERLRSYLTLAATLRDQLDDIDYVDLRFDERIYVRPRNPRPEAGTPRQASARY
ncbi:MAG: FtsQ-type POTRA domain-containing protein [Acidobacteriota bacterium]|nr:FtsQ-type POTRA domain-containing protein [Acidobacteriota bacterium]